MPQSQASWGRHIHPSRRNETILENFPAQALRESHRTMLKKSMNQSTILQSSMLIILYFDVSANSSFKVN